MITPQVTDGDLVLANGSFATVTSAAKVSQDIQIAVMTPYGTDRFHPRYGSIFSNYIGVPIGPGSSALISAEMTRVISNYMSVQLGKVKKASSSNLASPFSQGELVQSIGPINVSQQYDKFQVTASVNTASGQQVNVSTTTTS